MHVSQSLTAHRVDADPARALHPEAARDVDVNGDGDGAAEGVACDAGGQARAQISVVHHLPGVQQLCGLLTKCLDCLGMAHGIKINVSIFWKAH